MGSKRAPSTTKEPTPAALKEASWAFFHLYKTKMRAALDEVSSHQSSPSRVRVVVVLRGKGALPMGAIAMYVGLPKSNITALVDDLEAEGVLRRRQDEADRRITQVELTPKGRALCAREYDAYERSIASIFDVISESERKVMLSCFERLTEALQGDAEAPASAPAVRRPARGKSASSAR